MNLVRFECGCIGFAPGKYPKVMHNRALILVACDGDGEERYGLSYYDMSDKSYTPITDPEEIGQHIIDLQSHPTSGFVDR